MKIALLILALPFSVVYGMDSQNEQLSFAENVHLQVKQYMSYVNASTSFENTQERRSIAAPKLRSSIESCKLSWGKYLIETENTECEKIGSLTQYSDGPYSPDYILLEKIQKDLVLFCKEAENAKNFLLKYAPEKLQKN